MAEGGNGRGILKLVEEFNAYEKKPRRAKTARTLSLDSMGFLHMQNYCRERGIPISDVFDKLMFEFLETAGVDLTVSPLAPPPTTTPEKKG